ncbi:hypothetical protein ACFLU6_02295 [Acidobacteriota bacterium]
MAIILRFGTQVFVGDEPVGRLTGVLLKKKYLELHSLLAADPGRECTTYPAGSCQDGDTDRIGLQPDCRGVSLNSADQSVKLITADQKTRVYALDGWISNLGGVEVDERSHVVNRFIFDMGYHMTRIAGVERWFVKQFRENELTLRLTVAEITKYPPYLTKI